MKFNGKSGLIYLIRRPKYSPHSQNNLDNGTCRCSPIGERCTFCNSIYESVNQLTHKIDFDHIQNIFFLSAVVYKTKINPWTWSHLHKCISLQLVQEENGAVVFGHREGMKAIQVGHSTLVLRGSSKAQLRARWRLQQELEQGSTESSMKASARARAWSELELEQGSNETSKKASARARGYLCDLFLRSFAHFVTKKKNTARNPTIKQNRPKDDRAKSQRTKCLVPFFNISIYFR